MNHRRRHKSLLPPRDRDLPDRRAPLPHARRKRADKTAGSVWLFADFLSAAMTLPPDRLADFE